MGFEGVSAGAGDFSQYEIEKLQILPLLFQTGYLTVRELDGRKYTLGDPNREVSETLAERLLETYSGKDSLGGTVFRMRDALEQGDAEEFCRLVSGVFDAVQYPLIKKAEAYFHSIFFLIVKLLGFEIESEVLTSRGRMDAVVKTEKHIYIMEFKLGLSAKVAVQQIKDKGYAKAYSLDPRPITIIGIAYDPDKKEVAEVLIE